jgi:hypothetical protein
MRQTFPKDDFGVIVENNNGKKILEFLETKGFHNSRHLLGSIENNDYYYVTNDSDVISTSNTGFSPNYTNPTSKTYTLEELKSLDIQQFDEND